MKKRTKLTLPEVLVLIVSFLAVSLLCGILIPNLDLGLGGKPENYQPTKEQSVIFPLDVCVASSEELSQIPGISDIVANRIVVYRSSNYIFETEDLLNIEGINKYLLEYIDDYIYVGTD